ncbi:hypothetical protein PInf_004117 [Phytophthora infestans]|nr:hypothetical protein PInf_004117 [Phytophthora infestans]
MQPEYGILHNYLEFFSELPWNISTADSLLVERGGKQLDADHYGLDKVKKRITEYIAVRSLKRDMRGPILRRENFAGALHCYSHYRKFERVALGGVHDESEIRGHRKTYVGAMPGCILNALRHAETNNPVLLLDEVDKLGKDFRGDPASALLEVLDPHQNNTFTDHYLNVPFDLSRTLFLATANSLDTIPGPLLDLSGYSVEQKVEIARRYLLPQQIEANGLREGMVRISDEALRFLVMRYTREAGVRDLERQVGALCRYVAVDVVRELDESDDKQEKKDGDNSDRLAAFDPIFIDKKMIRAILGHELVFNEVALRSSVPGVATGMSWSTAGGSILFVEASCTRHPPSIEAAPSSTSRSNASPTLQLTGKLGDVMKESAQLALSWLLVNAHLIEFPHKVRTQAEAGELSGSNTLSLDDISSVHVHFPEGAISKDGPSAGGIREKVLAAIRAGIKRVILPRGNKSEAEELRKEFAGVSTDNTRERDHRKDRVQLLFVSDLRELIQIVFHMKVREDPGVRRLKSARAGGGVDYSSDPAEILDLIGKTQLSNDTMGFVMSSLFESKASIITLDTNVIGPIEHGAVSGPMTVFADMFKNLSKEKILIPVCCNKNHWCGIMVDVERTEAIVYDPMDSTYMVGVRALTEKIVTQLSNFAPRQYRVSPYRGNLGVQVDSFNCGMYVLLAFEVFAGADGLSYLNRKGLQYLR